MYSVVARAGTYILCFIDQVFAGSLCKMFCAAGSGAGRVQGVCAKYPCWSSLILCVLDLLQPAIFEPSLVFMGRSTLDRHFFL